MNERKCEMARLDIITGADRKIGPKMSWDKEVCVTLMLSGGVWPKMGFGISD